MTTTKGVMLSCSSDPPPPPLLLLLLPLRPPHQRPAAAALLLLPRGSLVAPVNGRNPISSSAADRLRGLGWAPEAL